MAKELKIQLDPNFVGRMRSFGMNWSATAQRPFVFQPTTFTAMIDGLKPKSFTRAKQEKMFEQFLTDPNRAGIYGISSAPNDGQSKLLAAWMMEQHMKARPENRPVWHDVAGGFDSTLLNPDPVSATLLVLNNLGPDSSPTKKEKLRDIITRYSDLPLVCVVNGADPFTFFTKDMRLAVSGVAYLTNGLVRKTHEV